MSQSLANDLIVAITGASGAAYGLRLLQRVGQCGVRQHVLLSRAARVVLKQELDLDLPETAVAAMQVLAGHLNLPPESLRGYELDDWFSPVASGSAGLKRMVIVPCSMGTMARVAGGISDNLIERAADVMLKERRQLIVVPRETPLSTIHLEHMLKLSQMGVHVIPAMPGFYHRPGSVDELVDFMVSRIMDHLQIEDAGAQRWGV